MTASQQLKTPRRTEIPFLHAAMQTITCYLCYPSIFQPSKDDL